MSSTASWSKHKFLYTSSLTHTLQIPFGSLLSPTVSSNDLSLLGVCLVHCLWLGPSPTFPPFMPLNPTTINNFLVRDFLSIADRSVTKLLRSHPWCWRMPGPDISSSFWSVEIDSLDIGCLMAMCVTSWTLVHPQIHLLNSKPPVFIFGNKVSTEVLKWNEVITVKPWFWWG
jgi:hypothetical protein